MANPLMGTMGGVPTQGAGINMQAIQQIRQTMNMLMALKNPQQALMQVAQQNQDLNDVLKEVGNRNPRDVFFEKCQLKGENPDKYISALRG